MGKFELYNKVAVITGATAGIGAEVARIFVSEGAKVALVARDIEKGGEMLEELGEENALFISGDVSDESTAKETVNATIEKFGKLDILVNNAAIDYTNLLLESPLEDAKQVFDINFFGSFLMLKECAEAMKEKGGAIVNITSRNGTVGIPTMGVYGATKSAIKGLTRTAAVELAPYNIRVNAVSPGLTKTPLIERYIQRQENPSEFEKDIIKDTPQKRMATSIEVANAILFLSSDRSTHVTGEQLAVDGGYTAR